MKFETIYLLLITLTVDYTNWQPVKTTNVLHFIIFIDHNIVHVEKQWKSDEAISRSVGTNTLCTTQHGDIPASLTMSICNQANDFKMVKKWISQ